MNETVKDVPPAVPRVEFAVQTSIVPLDALIAMRATEASGEYGGGGVGVCRSHTAVTVKPVNGSAMGVLVVPKPSVTLLDVTAASLPPPIVIGSSPSRQVDEARMRPFVWFTHTWVPSADASCVAA